MSSFEFTVPGKQVSTNAAYRKRGAGHGLYMTPEGKLWTKKLELAGRLARKGSQAILGPVEVLITYWFDSRRPDADGPTKLVLDAIEASGLIENDRQVARYQVTKLLDREAPRTAVVLRPFNQVELVLTSEELADAFDDAHRFGLTRG